MVRRDLHAVDFTHVYRERIVRDASRPEVVTPSADGELDANVVGPSHQGRDLGGVAGYGDTRGSDVLESQTAVAKLKSFQHALAQCEPPGYSHYLCEGTKFRLTKLTVNEATWLSVKGALRSAKGGLRGEGVRNSSELMDVEFNWQS